MTVLVSLLAFLLVVAVPIAAFVALSRTRALQERVEDLERHVRVLRRGTSRPMPDAAVAAPVSRPASAGNAPSGSGWQAQAAADIPPTGTPSATAAPAPVLARESPDPRPRPQQVEPAGLERWLQTVWCWFTDGNVPVKVGMVVLFAGVGALLKYATDQGWMRFPIELRLMGIAAAALAGLAFGWQQRHQRRVFALSVQGGAIGVLLMTAFAAYKLYAMFGATTAFVVWVILAAAAGALAVWQEARALAVLGILAGFLAPLAMSTGSANHVALFSFYAVLNACIFCIAWFRSWPELNLLGFVFTFGIGTAWGVLDYTPEKLVSTLPFLLLFFTFYLLIPIFNARHRAASVRHPVEASLVFGTPLLGFAQLAGLLEAARMPLALSALAVAAVYGLLAWMRAAGAATLLRQCHAVLAVGFATLSVPLALSAQATASVFALEGAALTWFGLAQSRRLASWAGGVLQLLAAVGFVRGHAAGAHEVAIFNPGFMSALLLATAGYLSAALHALAGTRTPALIYYLWGLAWWLVLGNVEIELFVEAAARADARLAFAAVSAALAGIALRWQPAGVLSGTVAAALAAALPLAIVQTLQHQHPFAGTGLAAWALYAVLGVVALLGLRARRGHGMAWAHAAWAFAWPLALMLWLQHQADAMQLDSGWRHAAMVLPWLLASGVVLLRPTWSAWPLGAHFPLWRPALLTALQVVVAGWGIVLLIQPGDAAPWPWIPLLNPLEAALLAALALLSGWLLSSGPPPALRYVRSTLLPLGMFLVLTSITLRAVHQLGGVPWDARMFDTGLAQASLSLVWSVLGVAGWITGSRRRQRVVWGIGAVLMGIVLAKLVLVDRQHLGNLPGIASFIGYGLLCTAVGYLAPAPPRDTQPAAAAA
jgi:uncharacterized membrane protein